VFDSWDMIYWSTFAAPSILYNPSQRPFTPLSCYFVPAPPNLALRQLLARDLHFLEFISIIYVILNIPLLADPSTPH